MEFLFSVRFEFSLFRDDPWIERFEDRAESEK